MNKKTISWLIIIGLLASAAAYWFSKEATAPAQTKKIAVVASFYPLADFAQEVGGDLIMVTNITPPGTEPHDYEPTPQDIAAVYNARLFIFNGQGLDSWAEKIASDVTARGIITINMSERIGTSTDPHFWLDPTRAQIETDVIAQAMIKIDPTRQAYYEQNRDNFKKELGELDAEYKAGLANCQLREIVTAHDAFNYLASRYNLSTFHILGLSPDEEPAPRTMAAVAQTAQQKNIKYIFFETLLDPKLAQTIAAEIGAQTLVLNPIEGLTVAEIATGQNYLSVMRNNLASLKIALACQ